MDFKVGLTDDAIADLGAIVEYIARHSAEAARHVGSELLNRADSLAVLPHRGATVRGRKNMRKIVRWRYAIYYRVNDPKRTVDVLRIWDMRPDPRELLLPR